ncbi:FAD-dependent oxidoreductase [Streptomyces sp. NPDC050617]|uniref:FAD-dependent oxidoreductase n=1 Tax=Streptomyces sp. NPDC050617 TaxID=3154628 RepID=UPI00343AC9D1
MRIAVIGAGTAGLTAAWLMDRTADVEVFEAAPRIGGHADSVEVDVSGRPIHVDLGAQHLAPDAFPAHAALREALGITAADLIPAPLHMTMMSPGAPQRLLVTPHARADVPRETVTGQAWEILGRFVAHAVAFEQGRGDWTTTLEELTAELGLDKPWTDGLIFPWLASFVGCSNDQAAAMSARAAIAWITRTAPSAPDAAPVFIGLARGMHHLAQTLASQLRNPVRTSTGIRQLDVTATGIALRDAHDQERSFDKAVIATPAPATRDILSGTRGFDAHTGALSAFPYVPTTISVHRDPAYMPSNRKHWSTNNIAVHDGWAETSTWYGPLQDTDVFKSWTTYRDKPEDTIAERTYQHLCVTPQAVRARTRLQDLRGLAGVHLAGSYLRDVDSQESAVRSALDAAQLLTADSPRLHAVFGLADLDG